MDFFRISSDSPTKLIFIKSTKKIYEVSNRSDSKNPCHKSFPCLRDFYLNYFSRTLNELKFCTPKLSTEHKNSRTPQSGIMARGGGFKRRAGEFTNKIRDTSQFNGRISKSLNSILEVIF